MSQATEEVRAEIALDLTLVDETPIINQGDPYELTYIRWRNQSAKLSFIYDYLLEKKKKRLSRLNIAVLALSTIVTLISATQFGIDQCSYTSVLIGLQVTLTVSSFFSTILGGIINIYGLSDIVNSIQRYLDTVEALYCEMAGEDLLPEDLRTNRKEFILANKDRWSQVLHDAPDVDNSEYLEALKVYNTSKSRFKTVRLPDYDHVE